MPCRCSGGPSLSSRRSEASLAVAQSNRDIPTLTPRSTPMVTTSTLPPSRAAVAPVGLNHLVHDVRDIGEIASVLDRDPRLYPRWARSMPPRSGPILQRCTSTAAIMVAAPGAPTTSPWWRTPACRRRRLRGACSVRRVRSTTSPFVAASFQPARLPPGMEPGLLRARSPNGCHVCELEVDPATGHVALQSYVVVDEVGTMINPLTLAGQIHGGLVQEMDRS